MNIIKETKTYFKTTDGHELKPYDEVIYTAQGKAFYGKFMGITERCDLKFKYNLGVKDFEWAVKPSTIDTIYVVSVEKAEIIPM